MDIVSIIFIIAGLACKVKGLVIASLALSVIGLTILTLINPDEYLASMFIYLVVIGLSIVKLCIWD